MKMYLCRDEDGLLHLLIGHHYPHKEVYERTVVWRMSDNTEEADIYLNAEEYPEVTFENSPMEVELKLK